MNKLYADDSLADEHKHVDITAVLNLIASIPH